MSAPPRRPKLPLTDGVMQSSTTFSFKLDKSAIAGVQNDTETLSVKSMLNVATKFTKRPLRAFAVEMAKLGQRAT